MLIAVCVLAVVVATAQVRYTGSDARASLLAAQTLLRTGSVHLEGELARGGGREAVLGGGWMVHTQDGHLVPYYPVGPVIAALPAVAVANALGADMIVAAHDAGLQIVLAAACVIAAFVTLHAIAALALPAAEALGLALLLVLGTSVASSLATAFWTHDGFVVCWSVVLWLLARSELAGRPDAPWRVGGLLAAALLFRPTALVLAAATFVYLLARPWRVLARALAAYAVGLAAVVSTNLLVMERAVPAYYHPTNWPGGRVAAGLAGVLVSPSRGLFVFSPFLALALVGILWRPARLRPLFWLGLGSSAALVALVARQGNWWGGWCFGPRLLVDAVPGLAVALVLTLAARPASAWPRRLVVAGLVVLGAASVAIHTVQGLYQPATYDWNDAPAIDAAPQRLFDWSDPQFLATPDRNERRRSKAPEAERRPPPGSPRE